MTTYDDTLAAYHATTVAFAEQAALFRELSFLDMCFPTKRRRAYDESNRRLRRLQDECWNIQAAYISERRLTEPKP